MTARAYQYRPPRSRALDAGPWRGMRDTLNPASDNPQYLNLLLNMFIRDPKNGGALETRPGQAWRVATGAVQVSIQWTRVNGTTVTVIMDAGEIKTVTWANPTPTLVTKVTAANFVTAGITRQTTNFMYVAVLNDKLIFSDNANNKPFMWDGGTGASSLTLLSNASAMIGPITIYYAKLFGVKLSEPTTLIWSEENDPTTGYEAGGFNNSWTLAQSDQGKIQAIKGTNEGLYYWRRSSIGVIRGAADVAFTTTGVHDAVSTTEGTVAPRSVLLDGKNIYFTDALGRPWTFPIGGVPQPMFKNLTRMFTHLKDTDQPTTYHPVPLGQSVSQGLSTFMTIPSLDLVVLGIVTGPIGLEGGYTHFDELIVFSRETKEPIAYWSMGNGFHGMSIAYNQNSGVTSLLMASNSQLTFLDDSVFNTNRDFHATETGFIEQVIVGHAHGYQDKIRWAFGRLDVEFTFRFDAAGGAANIEFDGLVPPGIQPGTAMATTHTTTNKNDIVRIPAEYNQEARWFRPIIRLFGHATEALQGFEWVQVNSWSLEAQPLDKVPYKATRAGI